VQRVGVGVLLGWGAVHGGVLDAAGAKMRCAHDCTVREVIMWAGSEGEFRPAPGAAALLYVPMIVAS
jgi:hypothetical protein